MTVKQLNNLRKGKSITAMVDFGKNTRAPEAERLRLNLRQAERLRDPQPVAERQVQGGQGPLTLTFPTTSP